MNDILDTIGAQDQEPFPLENLIPQAMDTFQPPIAAVRNRAAQAAMLTGKPEEAIDKYQAYMSSGMNGDQGPAQMAIDAFHKQDKSLDMEAVMGVLADPKLPIEQKRGAIDAAKGSKFLSDAGTSLLSKGLAAESHGETQEAEDARISTSDMLREMYDAKTQVQGLVNAHQASLSTRGTSGDVADFYGIAMPFSEQARQWKLAKAVAEASGREFTFWEGLQAIQFAGDSAGALRAQLASLPPKAQVEYAKTLSDAIKSSSGILYGNDNQYAEHVKLNQVFHEGGYSDVERFIENASVVLDLVGIGSILRGGKVAVQTAKPVSVGASDNLLGFSEKGPLASAKSTYPIDDAIVKNPKPVKNPDSGFEPIKVSTPEAGVNDARISELQSQVADLLGDAGNLAEKGDIAIMRQQRAAIEAVDTSPAAIKTLTKILQKGGLSYKEATKQATRQLKDDEAEYIAKITRLDQMIETNRVSSTVSQELDKLEKQIAELQKANKTAPAKKNPIVDAMDRIEANASVRQENPVSVAFSASQTNPAQARAIHQAVVASADDTVAEALYGTSKTQAVINDVYPQAVTESGNVTAKATDIQRSVRPKIALEDEMRGMIIDSDVAIHYSLEELALARSNIVNDFSSATDLVPNDAMGGFRSGFNLDGSGVEISAVYGTKEGAFTNAKQAFDQAKFGLRGQGVLDSEITVLRKQGLDYVPVKLEEVGDDVGSYLVRVTMRREVDPTDITRFDPDSVKRNFFDRSPGAVWNQNGSVSRWLFDAASMLHPRVTGAASVATDVTSNFEKKMLNIADQYANQYNKFPKERKAKIDEYVREANFKGIPFDTADLIGRGFNADEISSLRSWRDFWDAHHFLENYDVVRTMNSQGFGMFKTPTEELYAKAITKNSTVGRVYDPATGTVAELSPQALDNLYNTGGTLAKLRRPSNFTFNSPNGRAVNATTEYMVVRNTPTEYLRKFRDSDQVLNYRDGYYQIQYKAPRFVDEITLGTKGEELSRRAIAVAGDTAEANHFVSRLPTRADIRYQVRGDDKAVRTGGDDWFDTNAARGRIAQKARGKLLEDATGINHVGDGNYIVSPMESAIRAAKSVSGRTVNRPMLEAAKARFLANYSDVLQSNGYGGKSFPANVGEIGGKGQQFSKQVADARTNFEYIKYLENGYINTIDDFIKQQFNALGEVLGAAGHGRSEKLAFGIGEATNGPTSVAKGFVFQAYIGTNPIRNWVVQTNQAVRTFSYNPQAWLSGQMPLLIGDYVGSLVGKTAGFSKNGEDFIAFVKNSGLLDSVDKQNLIRGSLLQAADASSKVQRVASEAMQMPRKVGFDIGESVNLLGHAAAVFDKYRRAGKDVASKAVHREMHSETRAISYEMNFAGDMVYNQTSAAMLLQFLQVPHKAFLQATNRRIDPGVRARMLLSDIVLWGAAGTGIAGLISTVVGGDSLPEDKDLRKIYLDGLQSFILNAAMSELLAETDPLTGEKMAKDRRPNTDTDYSSLAPMALDSWAKLFHGMFTGGMSQVIMNSPSGQLFLADGGRVPSAISSMSKFFSPFEDHKRTKEEFVGMVNEVAKISSGWSNYMKMEQAMELGKVLDKKGVVIDQKVSNGQAILLLMGFGTDVTRKTYETQRVLMENKKKYEDNVKQSYKTTMQYYQSEFQKGIRDPAQMQAVTGLMLLKYKDDPKALGIIQKELERDLLDKQNGLMMGMIASVGMPQFNITVDQINQSPLPEDQKKQYIETLSAFKNARSAIKKDK